MEHLKRASSKPCTTIIDSNFINDSLRVDGHDFVRYLHDLHPEKLTRLSDSFTRRVFEAMQLTRDFLFMPKIVVLPEVATEIGAWSGKISRCAMDYREMFSRAQGQWRYRKMKYSQGLLNLDRIARRTGFIWESASAISSKYQVEWKQPESQGLYLLDAAVACSQDIIEQNRVEHNGRDSLGVRLQTDQKLAAYSFVAAQSDDVILMTGDAGVIRIVERLRDSYGKSTSLPKTTYPPHNIFTMDLNKRVLQEICPTWYREQRNHLQATGS